MKCSQVMTREPKTVKETDDAFYAARLMREHKIGFLPVRGQKDRVVGIVTDRDLAMKVCGGERQAVETEMSEVMSNPVVSCRPTDDVEHAMRTMKLHAVRRVVIIDAKGRPVGVVSQTDILALDAGSAQNAGSALQVGGGTSAAAGRAR